MKLLKLLLPLILLTPFLASGQSANRFSYHGRIINIDGSPIAGPINMTFKIYKNASGVADCTQSINGVTLSQGIFNVELTFPANCGAFTLSQYLAAAAVASDSLYIEPTDTTNSKTYNKQMLTALPFSFYSLETGSVSAESITDLGLSGISSSCANGNVIKTDGIGAFYCGTDNNAGGTVTSVATGTGLTGGPVTTTGTISIATGGVSTTEIADATITNTDINAAAAIAYSKLAAMATGNILAGNAGTPTSVTMSGDVTIGATGVTAIGAGVIVNAEINAAAAIAYSKLAAMATGSILAGNAGVPTSVAMSGDATISNTGVLTLANTGIGAGTYKSITVDTKGRATGGTNPTTLAGYGITDATSTTLTSGNVLVGSAGNVATSVAMSGDVTISNAGVTALGAGVIVNADVSASAAIDAAKIGATTTVSNTEFGYLDGVTSAIQTQFTGKEPTLTAGAATQYYRGDKTWVTLNGAAVTNTAAGNIVATTTQAAINELDTEKAALAGATFTGAVSVAGVTSNVIGAYVLSPYGVVAGNTSEIRFNELAASGANYVGFKSPDTLAANKIWVLPTADGTANQVLKTDGAANLGWATASTGTVTSVATGTGLTGGPVTTTGTISIAAGGVSNTEISGTAAIAYSKLASMATGNILAGNAGTPTSVTMSGDVTIGSTGVTAIGAGVIVNADISASAAIDAAKIGATTTVSNTEFGYLDGVTSAIQTQFTGKEPTITAGTTAQYYRGDKSWQTLNGAAVANTAAGNIAATTTQAAINELDTEKAALAGAAFTGAVTMNATNEFRLADTDSSNYVGFKSPGVVAANKVWILPSADGTAGQVLKTDGALTTSWVSMEAALTAGTTAQYYRGDKSWQTLNGAAVANTAAGNIVATTTQAAINELDTEKAALAGAAFTGAVTMNATNEFRLADTDSSNYVGFKSPGVVAANKVWILPSADGTAGQVLKTDGALTTSWVSMEAALTAGTTAQYYRGDKSWQTLNGAAVANTAAGNIVATTTQAAINELDTEKEAALTAGTTAQYYRGDKSWQTLNGAAVANTAAGNIAATTTQAAINELDTEKAALAGAAFTGAVTMNATNEFRLADTDSSNYVGFKSPGVVAANKVWILPSADGTAGQVLKTDGALTTSWVSMEAALTAGTTVQYYRGDKSWQTLNGAAVANTAAGNIVATTTQAAINELDTEKAALAGATFTGNITAPAFYYTSDRRLKMNFELLDNNLEKILSLQPYRYEFISRPSIRDIGLIAQDVQKVFPEAVGFNGKNLILDYPRLVAPIVGAIKELFQKIMGNSEEIEKIKEENLSLKNKVDFLLDQYCKDHAEDSMCEK